MKPDPRLPTNWQFAGTAFHPGLPGPGATGPVHISSTCVRFESDKGNVELPLDGLKIEFGGANDDLIFFSHPAQPQTTIHTADRSVLAHPVLAGNAALVAQGRRLKWSRRVALTVLMIVVGLLIASVLALVLAKNRLVKIAADSIPVEWEIKTGGSLFEQITASKRVLQNDKLDARLRKITDPLVAGIKDNRYPLTFHIIEDPTLNAFAMSGGHVVLHTGLLLAADSPEEIAGVLGHEIAHVTRRHSIRNVISSAGLYAVLQTVVGDATGIVGVIANNSAMLMERKFSRDFEREADEAGWNYLLAADIEPRGMIAFFETMREEEQKRSGVNAAASALAAVSTHPATQERLDTLQGRWELLDKKSGYRVFDLDYLAFKEELRAALKTAPK